jgi:hypothetical protein
MTPYHRGQVLAVAHLVGFFLLIVGIVFTTPPIGLVGLSLLALSVPGRLLACRCVQCSKSLFINANNWPPKELADLFLPIERVWPERSCSNCRSLQD